MEWISAEDVSNTDSTAVKTEHRTIPLAHAVSQVGLPLGRLFFILIVAAVVAIFVGGFLYYRVSHDKIWTHGLSGSEEQPNKSTPVKRVVGRIKARSSRGNAAPLAPSKPRDKPPLAAGGSARIGGQNSEKIEHSSKNLSERVRRKGHGQKIHGAMSRDVKRKRSKNEEVIVVKALTVKDARKKQQQRGPLSESSKKSSQEASVQPSINQVKELPEKELESKTFITPTEKKILQKRAFTLVRLAQKRGLYPGDDPAFDAIVKELKKAIHEGSVSDETFSRLQNYIDSFNITHEFVTLKIERLNRMLSNQKLSAKMQNKLVAESQQILQMAMGGQLIQASHLIFKLQQKLTPVGR